MRARAEDGGLSVHAVAGTYVVLLGIDVAEGSPRLRGLLGFALHRQDRGAAASQAYARRFKNRPPDRRRNPEAYPWLSRGLEEALLAFRIVCDAKRGALKPRPRNLSAIDAAGIGGLCTLRETNTSYTRVADIYLGEFMRLYTHYRFRAFAQQAKRTGRPPRKLFLAPDDRWWKPYYERGSVKKMERLLFS